MKRGKRDNLLLRMGAWKNLVSRSMPVKWPAALSFSLSSASYANQYASANI